MTIQPSSAIAAAIVAGLLVQRILGQRAGRAEDRHLGHVLVRSEDAERRSHLPERRARDLQVEPIGSVAGEAHSRGENLEQEVPVPLGPGGLDEVGHLPIELGVTGAIAGERE